MSKNVRSMTGQGHASGHGDIGTVTVELRTINNRGFKCTQRVSDSLNPLETKIESLARSMIHRGTVQMNVLLRKPASQDLPQIDDRVLKSYLRQLQAAADSSSSGGVTIDLANLAQLPGVVVTSKDSQQDLDSLWQFVQSTIVDAIENLNQMRSVEGERMAESLRADCQLIHTHLDSIRTLAPRSSETYRSRLENKVQRILRDHDLEVAKVDLLREVQIYADRVDISEEITRLDSHLIMFLDILGGSESGGKASPQKATGGPVPTGRKLDFVIQEMVRETNTMGSKASDAEISSHVVEIKCAIERMRELVQNLE